MCSEKGCVVFYDLWIDGLGRSSLDRRAPTMMPVMQERQNSKNAFRVQTEGIGKKDRHLNFNGIIAQ